MCRSDGHPVLINGASFEAGRWLDRLSLLPSLLHHWTYWIGYRAFQRARAAAATEVDRSTAACLL